MRIRFLPSGTPGYPQTDGVGSSPAPQYRRIHGRPERLKYFAIAEKTGDVDQDVPVKLFHLIPVLLKDADVGAQVLHSPQRHASHDAATYSGGFVTGKIHPADLLQQAKDLRHIRGLGPFRSLHRVCGCASDIRMLADAD